MSYNNISFTDGFNGKTLSIFNEDAFQKKNIYLSFSSSVSKLLFVTLKFLIFSFNFLFKSSILGNPKDIVAPDPQTIKGGKQRRLKHT
jgi:hypothetical protein